MKIQPILAFSIVLTASAHAVEEAWYLEMEPRFADLIVSKYLADDKKSYLQALDMIPNLIKDGKISEIERITYTPDHKGGTHFTKQTVEVETPVKSSREIGSDYYRANDNQLRFFEIKTKKTLFGMESIQSLGSLPKNWMPSFHLNNGTTVRLLLERDTDVTPEFFPLKQRLQVSRTTPDNLTATWFLSQPVVDSVSTSTVKPGIVFQYSNTEESPYKEGQQARDVGTSLEWTFTQGKKFNFAITHTKLLSETTYSHEAQQANGEVTEQGALLKAEITARADEEKDGQVSETEKPSPGVIEYGILPVEK